MTADTLDSHAPSAIVRLALAYQASHALYVATELGIPDLLASGSLTICNIARETGTEPNMMLRLMRALSAFGIFRDLGNGAFELTHVGQHLRSDCPQAVAPLVRMYGSDHSRQMFASLAECVRTGKNAFEIQFGSASSFDYLSLHPELANVFNDGMSAVSYFAGPAAAKAYNFSSALHIVDVGGGHGRILASILKANPHMRGTLFELPRVIDEALPLLLREGIADRCARIGGDMFVSVPAGGDLYFLSHVIHNWGDAQASSILQACRRAMSDRGKLLILDRIFPNRIEPDTDVQGKVLIDLTMMVRTGGGRERTIAEFQSLLAASRLRFVRAIPLDNFEHLIEAVPYNTDADAC